ncbi:MAG TPA: thioredoxin domain-containing protein, partial [Tissierellaceae bacterium]|nr:thioredoxin domain-containing protein [Tissierellaceae bacterium]
MLKLDKDNFEKEVLQEKGYVLVDFWSPTCQPCKALMPHVEKLSEEYGDKIKFTALDTSKARRVAIGQKVMGLPALVIYKNGEKVESLIGQAATEEAVEE